MTYGRIVVNYCPKKSDHNRVRLTVGGNRINYLGDYGMRTSGMLTVKLLLNSFISTKVANFMSIDIKHFYLNTPISRYEYMRLKIAYLPHYFIDEYKLQDKKTRYGYVYLEIRKGMYGLPQAGILAQKLLGKRLIAKVFRQSGIYPGFGKYDWRPICFSLFVDNSGSNMWTGNTPNTS